MKGKIKDLELEKNKLMGEEVNMAGYPGVSGNDGPTAYVNSSAAISATIKDEMKGAAWEFIKTMISEDVQKMEKDGNPVNIAAYTYKKSKENREKQYAFRVKKYEMQIEQEKARLVNGLIKDLKTWLSNAEQFSNDILVSLGIQ